jgi:diguanylate cyclase (GGDEF)-like protein/PAS domain S-box-containing protein
MMTTSSRARSGSAVPAVDELNGRARFWRWVVTMRWVSAALLCSILAAVPSFGPNRVWFAAAFALTSAVQNAVIYQIVRRTGEMPKVVAISDFGFAVPIAFVLPVILPWVLVILAATMALLTLGYPARFCYTLIAVSAGPYLALCLWRQPDGWIPAYAIWLICSVFTVLIIGSVATEERSLRDRYTDLLEQLEVVVWEATGSRDQLTYTNERLEKLLGYAREQWTEPGFWERIVHPDDWAAVTTHRAKWAAGMSHELEYRIRTAAGHHLWVLELIRCSRDAEGILHGRGVMIDVTTRRDAEQEVRRLATLVAASPLAMAILRLEDPDDPTSLRFVTANRAALEQMNVTHEQLLAWRPPPDGSKQAVALRNGLANVVRTGEPFRVDAYEMHTTQHGRRLFRIEAVPLVDRDLGLITEDVTERVDAANSLRHQALHDPLTGLANRALLHDRLTAALHTAERTGDQVALMIMDLNQFKEVNDALGHHHGDRLLVELGQRLQAVVREADLVARLGGDEFAVLMTTGVTIEGALELARRISETFAEPIEIDGITLQSNVSVGIAISPDHGTDPESLTRHADVAMYQAKTSGAGVALYAAGHDTFSVRRLTLTSELRAAVSDGQMVLHYQPRIDLRSGNVVDVEALIRWNHPEHGLLPPAEFIPLAEVSGVIQPLTAWVIEQACEDIAECRREFPIGVAVNLSVRNLYDPKLQKVVESAVRRFGLRPGVLRVEITETELMDDPALAMDVLTQLGAIGVTASVDDFGTGYSSLSYLRNLPVSEIKIDRSFVTDLERGDATLVRSIVDLGHNLGMRVVAEGVESGPVLQQLAEEACDSAQGFFISRPLALDDLRTFLRRDGDHYRAWLRGTRTRREEPAGRAQR